tara:strand:+ start:1168 stop:1992 length:825 start_codon:yes stop_codon:yes gene_type:complete
MEKQIYFQSSLPRSGSTLLQNVIGQNPEFYVTPTSGTLELLYSAREQYSNSIEFTAQDSKLMKAGFKSFCKQGLQGFYSGVTDKPRVMDKSRGWGIHQPFLKTFVDNPKVVCMVRDPRCIFSSMEKNYRKNPEKSNKILNWSSGQGTTIEKRVNLWASGPPVGLAMERLKEVIDLGIADEMLFVRYEDLASNPEVVMKGIYKYLEVDNYSHDFKNVEQLTQEDDTVHGILGLHDIRKEITPLKKDYNEVLGKPISDNIVKYYRWFYEYFRYYIN